MSVLAPAPFEVDVEALNALPAEERALELRRLEAVNAGLAANPLFRYVPHEGEKGWKLRQGIALDGTESRGQVAFHECSALGLQTGAIVAGNRYGKTEGGFEDMLIQTLPDEFIPPWLAPYKQERYRGDYEYRGRVVGVDLPNWLEKTMLPKLRKGIPAGALYKGAFDKAWNERKRLLRFADGSWWDFLTHDMEVDAFGGTDVDRVWFDEEPSGEVGVLQFDESLARIIDRDGDVRWTLTPLLGLNFVYYELTGDDGQPRDDEECRVVRGDIDHNPHLSERGRAKYLKRYAKQPLKLKARKEGRWVHFAGLIYEEWDERRHVVPDRDIPRVEGGERALYPIDAMIDPGINKDHRAALIFFWHELVDDGEREPYDQVEVFHSRRFEDGATVADVSAHYHGVCAKLRFRPRWTVIDPSARNRNHATGRSIQDEYRKHQVHTIPGQNSREAGFNAIKERLAADPPRLVVQASNDELCEEFREYRWKSPKGKAESAPKAEPIKRKDDLMDALRYGVMQLTSAPKAREPEPEEAGTPEQQSFRAHLKRIAGGRGRRSRIGGVMPS